MKKFIAVLVSMTLFLSITGCATVCTKMTPERFDQASMILKSVQANYGTLVALGDVASSGKISGDPTTDFWVRISGPILLALADSTLKIVGNMIATGCDDSGLLAITQVNANKIQTSLAEKPAEVAVQQLKSGKFKK